MTDMSLSRRWSGLGIIFFLTSQEDLKLLIPDGVLTPPLLDELKTHKPEILQNLREKYAGIPVDWSNAIETTSTRNKPKGISKSRWIGIVKRLDILMHEGKSHLLKIIEYGLPLEEIFGCHTFAPDVRTDGMGLLMLLPQSIVSDIKMTGATLTSKTGAITTYRLGMMNRHQIEHSSLMETE